MSKRDSILIKQIKEFFKVGIYKESESYCYFDVNSIQDLQLVIEHFHRYPLQSSKRNMFNIFVILFNMFKCKEHLTHKGIMLSLTYINALNSNINQTVLNEIATQNNLGSLPLLILPPVPIISKWIIPNPWWITGFVLGEGSFTFFKRKRITSSGILKLDYTLVFEVSQKTEDIYLLEAMKVYFSSGGIFTEKRGMSRFRITNIKALQHIVLPFFSLYPLKGYKNNQFNIWLEALSVILSNPSWTKEREEWLSTIFNKLSNLK